MENISFWNEFEISFVKIKNVHSKLSNQQYVY
jgi:hypothetical protein